MFNLLVMNGGWPLYRSSFPRVRLLEHTTDEVRASIDSPMGLNLQALKSFPCLFMPEQGSGDDLGRVGTISGLTPGPRDLTIEYSFDPHIPPFPVS